jgi:hypothetical protein
MSTRSAHPAATSAPFGYTTDFTGQGLAARVVYRSSSGHIEELSMLSSGIWHAAPDRHHRCPGRRQRAVRLHHQLHRPRARRVVYRATSGHIEELSLV